MNEASHRDEEVLAQLLGELSHATDFREACLLVLGSVLEGTHIDRAAIVVVADGEMRGEGWGLPRSVVKSLMASASTSTTELARAVKSPDPEVVAVPLSQGRLTDLGSLAVYPLTRATREPLGALLLEVAELDDTCGHAAAIVRRTAFSLQRILELESLREQTGKLRREKELQSRILDTIADPVTVTDSSNQIVFTNRKANELFFSGPSSTEGRSRAVRRNTFLFSTLLTQEMVTQERSANRELDLIDPSDGSDLHFEIISSRMPSFRGEEGHVVSILRDITDLRRAVMEVEREARNLQVAQHRAARESERLNAIIENVGEPVLVTDARSDIVLMNPEAERLFEFAPGPQAQSRREGVLWANVTRFTGVVSDFLIETEMRRVEQITLRRPDSGEEFPVKAVNQKILDDRGETNAIVSVLRDMTEAVKNARLARELRELNEELEDRVRAATEELKERNRLLEWQSAELERASRLKTQFLANMSHEVRTPINAMLGYTSLLRERIYGDLNQKQEVALEKLDAAAEHLLELINDILDLSKIETGKVPVQVDRVPLEALFSEISQTIEPLIQKKPLAFELELDPDLPVITTDRTKIRQILINLVDNAVKYTPEGRITLRATRVPEDAAVEREKPFVRFEVEDTGKGIRSQELDQIFENFRQADESPTREFGGAGLGLPISRNLAILLGGTLSVESEYGQGSRFIVDLPVELEPGDWEEDSTGHAPGDVQTPVPSGSPTASSQS